MVVGASRAHCAYRAGVPAEATPKVLNASAMFLPTLCERELEATELGLYGCDESLVGVLGAEVDAYIEVPTSHRDP